MKQRRTKSPKIRFWKGMAVSCVGWWVVGWVDKEKLKQAKNKKAMLGTIRKGKIN